MKRALAWTCMWMVASAVACQKQSAPEPDAATEPSAKAEASTKTSEGAAKEDARGSTEGEEASEQAALGEPAPGFSLPALDGTTHRLADHRGKIVVLEWFNPECPFVRQAHTAGSLKGMAADSPADVVWLAINSGAPGKQGHGRAINEKGKERYGIDYPILLDESGEVGRAYGAEHTPHMAVIDRDGTLVYQGALDNTNGGDLEDFPEVQNYVADALSALEEGTPVDPASTEAWGCSVKY